MDLEKSKRIGWGREEESLLESCLIKLSFAPSDEKNQTVLLSVGGTFMEFNSAGMCMFILARNGVRKPMSHLTHLISIYQTFNSIPFIDLKS